jgi:hypothetical protein
MRGNNAMGRLLTLLCIVLLCVAGCNKEDDLVGSTDVRVFDLTLGKSWTYKWTFVTTDSSGKIINNATDTVQVRIAAINDSLQNFKGLIRFEAQSTVRYTGVSKVWYQFTGDSLVEVAYNVKGSSMALPKNGIRNISSNVSEPSVTSLFPTSVITLLKARGVQDSAMFRDDIRIVYKFPFSNGEKWTSFTTPFLQTREVIGSEMLERAGKKFLCIKIQTRLPLLSPDIEWFDYVSQEGLIERNIRLDGIVITTSDSPEGIGYGHTNELLELIN